MRPLDGILVVDFSTLLPGPLATLVMAEAGAEVVKIERPGHGDEMRGYQPRWGTDSVNFTMLNRGKKSVVVDLKDANGRGQLDDLIRRADILVEQFRPGVMARLGLGFQDVSRINPRLIYCSITGYGQTGVDRNRAGHDLNYIAETGLLALSMGSPEKPVVPPVLVADIAGGAYPALFNILLALRERDRTGRGVALDIAMSDNLFSFMYWALGNGLAAGRWPGNGTELVTGGTPRYRLYPTADGRVVAAAPIEQKFWERFCEEIGLEESLRDDAVDPQLTAARVSEIIATDTAENWRSRFLAADCCCSIVNGLEEALANPHFIERGVFSGRVVNAEGAALPALPTPLAPVFRDCSTPLQTAPELGAHTKEYLNARSAGA